MMSRRRFGKTLVSLSAICYGTMRLVPERCSEDEIFSLFLEAVDAGITSFHVSHEYDSYAAVCRALIRVRRARPRLSLEIVAKLAAPHFGETDFHQGRLRQLIEATLIDLDTDHIDVVQWLVRQTPNDDEKRLAVLDRSSEAFFAEWIDLQSEGKAIALGAFPYSDAFLRRVLAFPKVDGIVSYYNRSETELAAVLDELLANGRGAIAIRPLAGGTVRGADAVSDSIAFALDHRAIACTIIGLSTREQIMAAVAACRP